jgi:hypothetical protein
VAGIPNKVISDIPVVASGDAAHANPVATAPAVTPGGIASQLAVDSSGNLKCAVTGAGSGGTSSVDQSTFTAGTSAGTPIMAEDPTSGELLIVQMSPGTRQLSVAGTLSVSPTQSNTSSAVAQTTVGTSASTILAANGSRKRLTIQNTGTTDIYLAFAGKTPTNTAYHRALPACGVANDGSSQPYDDVMETGAVSAISSAAGGTCVVEERT